MRTIALMVAGVALGAAVACSHATETTLQAPAPVGDGVVFRGVVADLTSFARLQSVGVELANVGSSNKPFASTVTDDKGEFVFAGLAPGKYMIHIVRPGYNEVRMRVDAKTSDDKPLDVRMRALPDRLCVPSRYHTLECP